MNCLMRHQTTASSAVILQRLSLSAAVVLLAACGGGGTTQSLVLPDPPTVVGTITTGTGAPISDAVVTIGTETAQSDGTGAFTVAVDTATLNTETTVVATVAKDGYVACTGTVNLTAGTLTGCDTLTAVATDELLPSTADSALVRLGDGEVTSGTTNSKLQLTVPLGLTKTVPLGWSSALTLSDFQTFTVNVSIRGLQASTCANRIAVLQGATAESAIEIQAFSGQAGTLADSDLAGEFTDYPLPVPASSLSASGGNVYVKLEAGNCVNATASDPADDFEFVGLRGKFS